MTNKQCTVMFAEAAVQRWREAERAEPRIRFGTPEQLPGNATDVQKEFYGLLPQSRTRTTSLLFRHTIYKHGDTDEFLSIRSNQFNFTSSCVVL